MLQRSPSPTDSPSFVPRKEFIREAKPTPNSFGLVAISSSNLVRLYSFSPSVVSTIRNLLERYHILSAFREDIQQNLCEFCLDSKPWSSPKSVKAEKLLIDIFTIIYQCGYTYLSNLDYGRESDDRLAMAFSKPASSVPASRSDTPLLNSAPIHESDGSISFDKPRRVPFALSFVSPTLMRVIAPPLHLTPAILQAVRASWPRGVVSEKKVGDNSFEFKLKGYKWFQQDTFATDSLIHILALLSSLDAQAFTLLSSISLTNRSRVKDLWVFTGPGSNFNDDLLRQDSAVPSALNSSNGDIMRRADFSHLHQPATPIASYNQHRRAATEGNAPASLPLTSQHVRAVTDEGTGFHVTHGYRTEPQFDDSPVPGPSLLRKPAPRAQVPVSVHEVDHPTMEAIRANLPSTISSGIEDMTGVGATGFSSFYSGTPVHASRTTLSHSRSETPPGNRPRTPLAPVTTRPQTPPLVATNNTASSSSQSPPAPVHQDSVGSQLLGPGVFRDSAFSSNTDTIYDVPIKWSGMEKAVGPIQHPKPDHEGRSRPPNKRESSMGPILPGGWQSSPIEEKAEETTISQNPDSPTSDSHNGSAPKTPIHEVTSRATPELTRPDMYMRKSEAAVVGMISDTSSPALPARRKVSRADTPNFLPNAQGWVLVNVEGTAGLPQPASNASQPAASGSEAKLAPTEAKAIAIMDAVDSRNRSKTNAQDVTLTPKKRFFGLGRKNSKKILPPQTNESELTPSSSKETSKGSSLTKSRSGLRDKLRLIGTPEASRNESKRRSLD
ncbi:hypothetical protein H0H81_003753 [Sphagnurus paluster]|uniref:Uncharacterized protein n=1 Tax=Sphagnurus paluster TaxID=117069 RepID=A0A9P7GWM1_9AGAR|nr:hypothetical protein H0H81_003753 [Sphagnurus paluster]